MNIQNINILCSDCFNPNEYLDFLDLLNYHKLNLFEISLKIFYIEKKIYVNKKEFVRILKDSNTQSKRQERKKLLLNKLKEMKMDYIKNICDSYIKFGTPNLDNVVKALYIKQTENNNKLCMLLDELRNRNLEYDDKVPSYQKYIKKGGDLNKIIENGELEKILIAETNYLSIIDDVDSEIAREISLNTFYDKGKKSKLADKYVKSKNTLRFE
jgi:hypothetical protein